MGGPIAVRRPRCRRKALLPMGGHICCLEASPYDLNGFLDHHACRVIGEMSHKLNNKKIDPFGELGTFGHQNKSMFK